VIRVELRKLLRRPRTWASVFLLTLLPTVVAVFVSVQGIAPRPGTGPAFLSAVLGNGALFPAAALAIVLPLFLPVAVAVVAGDAIAGEAQAGTLRYLLVRPVSRTRLLVAKLVATIAYTMLAVVLVAVVAYLVGTHLFGSAPLPTVSGTTLSTRDAILRTVLAVLYVGWSMLGVAAVALFLSTVTDSPLVRRPGHSRRRLVYPAVPADPLLAGVRRPVPVAGALARPPPRHRAAGDVRARLPDRCLGQLRHQGHHQLRPLRRRCLRRGAPICPTPWRRLRGRRRGHQHGNRAVH